MASNYRPRCRICRRNDTFVTAALAMALYFAALLVMFLLDQDRGWGGHLHTGIACLAAGAGVIIAHYLPAMRPRHNDGHRGYW